MPSLACSQYTDLGFRDRNDYLEDFSEAYGVPLYAIQAEAAKVPDDASIDDLEAVLLAYVDVMNG